MVSCFLLLLFRLCARVPSRRMPSMHNSNPTAFPLLHWQLPRQRRVRRIAPLTYTAQGHKMTYEGREKDAKREPSGS